MQLLFFGVLWDRGRDIIWGENYYFIAMRARDGRHCNKDGDGDERVGILRGGSRRGLLGSKSTENGGLVIFFGGG